MVTIDIDLRQQQSGAGTTCLQILGSLPEWFGIETAVQHYAEVADRSHTIVATARGEDVGLLVITHHSPYAAEVYVMAVRPEHHRRGIGRWMLALAEATLAAGGTEYLQVKTLSSSHRDEGYARTRAFYTSCGFRPLRSSRPCGARPTRPCNW